MCDRSKTRCLCQLVLLAVRVRWVMNHDSRVTDDMHINKSTDKRLPRIQSHIVSSLAWWDILWSGVWAREQRVINNRSVPCLKFIAARTHFSGADPRANVMASRAARSPSSSASEFYAFITLLAFVIVGRTGAQHEEA